MQNIYVTKKCLDEALSEIPGATPQVFKVKTGTAPPLATIAEAPATLLEADTTVPALLIPFEGPVTTVGTFTAPTAGAYSLNIRTVVRATSPVPFRVQGVEALQLEASVDGVKFYPVPNAQWAGPSHGGDEDDADTGAIVHHSIGFLDVFLPAGLSTLAVRATVVSNYATISARYEAIVSADLAYITLSEVAA
jgi:hypothetical protein